MRRFLVIVAAVVAAVVVAAVVAGQSRGSGPGVHWTPVSFTATASLVGDDDVLLKSKFPGCVAGDSITTVPADSGAVGDLLVFTGSKTLTCVGGSFTFQYRAFSTDGASYDWGSWMISGGTGDYAAVNGGGEVAGSYVYDADGTATGLVDEWEGRIWLP